LTCEARKKKSNRKNYATVNAHLGQQFFWEITIFAGIFFLTLHNCILDSKSSEEDCGYLQFYIDDLFKDQISGNVDCRQESYTVSGSGSHTLKWRYFKNGNDSSGDDCGWVDFVQWTGPTPTPDTTNSGHYHLQI